MLSAHFDGNQSRVPVNLSCLPITLPLPSGHGEARRLLFHLDSYGGTDSLGMFPIFLKRTADGLVPCLSVVFRQLLRLESFPVGWRVANITPISKGLPFASVANYRPISLTPILVSVRLGRFMECRGVLPTTQFAYGKGLGTYDAILCVAHTLQYTLEMGEEARMVQIEFSAVCDYVNHQGILFKLCSVRIGGSELSVLTQFLSNWS